MFHCTIDHIPHIYCSTSNDCDEPPYSFCDVAHHSCITADGDMGIGDMMGVGPDMFCASSAACSDVAPICSVQRCRACTDSSDDVQCVAHNRATPRCNAPTGACVACLASTDCMNPTPVCDTAAMTCGKCVAHSQCASGICQSDGSCAASADVAYVNNASGACTDTVHASTPMMPYCQIQYAASNSSKAYLVVSASATTYNALTFAATTSVIGPITIVGPAGRGGAAMATVAQSALPAVSISSTGPAVTVTLDGLDLRGSGSPTTAAGVQCQPASGTVKLTIVNSTIQMSGREGVTSSGCTLTLDANIISSNANEGVKLASTTFVITNNIVNTNGGGSGLPGINITDAGSTGMFAFNTIAGNGGANSVAGGIACPTTGTAPAIVIQDSIVAQNAHNPMANGTQFVGKCQLQSVVTGQDSFTGATQSAPVFTADFHLDVSSSGLSTNEACCIDKVASATTPNASHDVDEGPRPKVVGTSLDIGAHEAK